MSEEVVINLFGEAEMPRAVKRGRPAHRWNEETANQIKLLQGMGWTDQRIADGVGLSLPTLKKHYFSVLKAKDKARDQVRARALHLLWKAAEKGNVGAIKQLRQEYDQADAMAALQAKIAQQDRKVVNTPMGKKEIAQQEADSVTGLFQAPAGPTIN